MAIVQLGNLGIGTLKQLKDFVLADSMRASTDYDDQLTALGLEVAGVIEAHCGRTFRWKADAQDEFPADRSGFVTVRYPIAALSSVEISTGLATEAPFLPVWTPLSNVVQNMRADAGLIYLKGYQGMHWDRLRITYNGGYWFATTTGEGDGADSEAPDGSTPMPADLQGAWLLQCQHLWSMRDNLGKSIAAGGDDGTGNTSTTRRGPPTLSSYKLLDPVVEHLRKYVRYNLSG